MTKELRIRGQNVGDPCPDQRHQQLRQCAIQRGGCDLWGKTWGGWQKMHATEKRLDWKNKDMRKTKCSCSWNWILAGIGQETWISFQAVILLRETPRSALKCLASFNKPKIWPKWMAFFFIKINAHWAECIEGVQGWKQCLVLVNNRRWLHILHAHFAVLDGKSFSLAREIFAKFWGQHLPVKPKTVTRKMKPTTLQFFALRSFNGIFTEKKGRGDGSKDLDLLKKPEKNKT